MCVEVGAAVVTHAEGLGTVAVLAMVAAGSERSGSVMERVSPLEGRFTTV
jgi:hypothetical protein